MMKKRKTYRVKHGNSSLVVHHWKDAFRFVYRDASGARKYISASTLEKAKEKAVDVLTTLGAASWTTLTASRQSFLLGISSLIPAGDEAEVLQYLQGRVQSSSMSIAVAGYREHLAAKGRSSDYVAMVMRDLEHLAAAFPVRVRDISADMLREWHAARCQGVGNARKIAVRAACTAFWKWCRREGLVGNDGVTPADRLPMAARDKGSCYILTREQLDALLVAVPAKHRAWVLIGAWAGLRPEEIAPKRSKIADGKRGLHWEDIDFTFMQIRVAAETSKVDCVRLVPLCSALAEALEPLRSTGPVCLSSPAEDKTLRNLGISIFGGAWPKDCLRHSYGSYRNALTRNMPRVAEEMGTSVAMLHRHYHNPQAEALGKEWFGVVDEVPQKSHKKKVSHSV